MKGGESLGDEESSKKEEEVVPALILASGARPLAPDVKSYLSYPHATVHFFCIDKTERRLSLIQTHSFHPAFHKRRFARKSRVSALAAEAS
jgi:hypothetical protein